MKLCQFKNIFAVAASAFANGAHGLRADGLQPPQPPGSNAVDGLRASMTDLQVDDASRGNALQQSQSSNSVDAFRVLVLGRAMEHDDGAAYVWSATVKWSNIAEKIGDKVAGIEDVKKIDVVYLDHYRVGGLRSPMTQTKDGREYTVSEVHADFDDEHWPFDARTFDVIMNDWSTLKFVTHVQVPGLAAKVALYLRPGGVAIFQDTERVHSEKEMREAEILKSQPPKGFQQIYVQRFGSDKKETRWVKSGTTIKQLSASIDERCNREFHYGGEKLSADRLFYFHDEEWTEEKTIATLQPTRGAVFLYSDSAGAGLDFALANREMLASGMAFVSFDELTDDAGVAVWKRPTFRVLVLGRAMEHDDGTAYVGSATVKWSNIADKIGDKVAGIEDVKKIDVVYLDYDPRVGGLRSPMTQTKDGREYTVSEVDADFNDEHWPFDARTFDVIMNDSSTLKSVTHAQVPGLAAKVALYLRPGGVAIFQDTERGYSEEDMREAEIIKYPHGEDVQEIIVQNRDPVHDEGGQTRWIKSGTTVKQLSASIHERRSHVFFHDDEQLSGEKTIVDLRPDRDSVFRYMTLKSFGFEFAFANREMLANGMDFVSFDGLTDSEGVAVWKVRPVRAFRVLVLGRSMYQDDEPNHGGEATVKWSNIVDKIGDAVTGIAEEKIFDVVYLDKDHSRGLREPLTKVVKDGREYTVSEVDADFNDEQWPLDAGSFDVVMNDFSTLKNVFDDGDFAAKVALYLRPGGVAIFQDTERVHSEEEMRKAEILKSPHEDAFEISISSPSGSGSESRWVKSGTTVSQLNASIGERRQGMWFPPDVAEDPFENAISGQQTMEEVGIASGKEVSYHPTCFGGLAFVNANPAMLANGMAFVSFDVDEHADSSVAVWKR